MISIALCLSFVSIFCLYAASDKVEWEKRGIMLFLRNKKALSLLLAGLTFLISTLIFISRVELGVGIFISLSLWMTLASLATLFLPFNIIKWQHLAAGILVAFAIEILPKLF